MGGCGAATVGMGNTILLLGGGENLGGGTHSAACGGECTGAGADAGVTKAGEGGW